MSALPEFERAAKLASSNAQFGTLPDVEFASREELRARIQAGLPIMGAGADASDIVPIDQRLYPPVPVDRNRQDSLDWPESRRWIRRSARRRTRISSGGRICSSGEAPRRRSDRFRRRAARKTSRIGAR